MRFKIESRQIWEFGQRIDEQGNPHQEDCIFPAFGQTHPGDRLFILCDGMGGHDNGEVASATVCATMSETILAAQTNAEGAFDEAWLQTAVERAFDALDVYDNG
ncbi:MAG: hypothetical protein HUK03_05305, partial [Bacteroidaceae bacterium]|nr:hypothetical protein [Bacteroidaceae bacterium]